MATHVTGCTTVVQSRTYMCAVYRYTHIHVTMYAHVAFLIGYVAHEHNNKNKRRKLIP